MPDASIDPGYGGYAATNRLLATPTNDPSQANAWAQNRILQLTAQRQQLELAHQKLGAVYDVASSVMADPSPQNAQARIADAIHQGVMSPEDGAAELQTIAGFGGDQAKIRQYAFQHAQAAASYQERIGASFGAPSMVNTGNALTPVLTKQGPGAGVYGGGGGAIPLQQSPESAGEMISVPQSDGSSRMMTKSQAQAASGYGAVARGDASVVNGQIVYKGAKSAAGAPQATNAQGQAVGANGQPTTVLPGIAGPSPMLATGRDDYRADLQNSSSKMQGVQPLLNALPLVQQLGSQGSGPTSAAFNQAKSALVTLGVLSPDTKDVDAYQEAKKYLNQYVSKSALAGRSDMGQLQQQVSSPNLETSNKATVALTQNAIAADRMEAARPLTFGSDDLGGYTRYKGGFTQDQDLRAYKIDLMSPSDRAALLKDMKAKAGTPEGQKFWHSLQTAHDAKVINAPSAPVAVSGQQ